MSEARRAVLLGCSGGDLAGVPGDLATMRSLLARHGFTDVVALLEPTRADVLAALRALIDRTARGDAVVVYYSGHGWRVDLPGGRRDGRPASFQGIAPADFSRSTAADFRGVLADELAALLDQLSERTANVTAVFDCCHATGLTRGAVDTGRERSMPVPWTVPAAEFHAALRAQGLLRERDDVEANPLAVRLYACRPHETAGEDPRAPGGLLTRALAAALAECDHGAVVWEDLARRVDALVRQVRAGQHPVVVGPARRHLFSLDERALAGATACITRDGARWIVGGALTDIRVGDAFVAVPAVARDAAPTPRPALARLEVTAVDHQLARTTGGPSTPLPDGATVVPVAWGSPRAAVVVDRPELAAAISATGLLRAVAAADVADLPVIAALVAGPAGLELRTPAGVEIRRGLALARARVVLANMARAATLRRLAGEALDPATHAFELEWSAGDPPRALAADDALPAAARICARVHNRGALPLYVTLLVAEADGHVRLLSTSEPGGRELLPGATYTLGERRLGGAQGVALGGPTARAGADVTLVAAMLEQAVPLGAWETVEHDDPTRGDDAALMPAELPQHPVRATVVALDLRFA